MSSTYPEWFRKRGYIHFDLPVGFDHAHNIVSNPDSVSRHAFFPLIHYSIQSEKVAKDPTSKKLELKTKSRPIAYASHIDSHIYSYYAFTLAGKYEAFLNANNLSDSIVAFRQTGKSNIEIARDAFKDISKHGNCIAIALDISGFFDNLDHSLLRSSWAQLLGLTSLPSDHFAVFRSLTRFSMVDRNDVYKKFGISIHNPSHDRRRICTAKEFRDFVRASGLVSRHKESKGIPQGTPISATLSNIYMMSFDLKIKEYVARVEGTYLRYCDDLLLILPNATRYGPTLKQVRELVKEVKLKINKDKTEIRRFKLSHGKKVLSRQPLQYLGFTYDGERILIRSAAFARFSKRMKKGVRLAKATMQRWNNVRTGRGELEKPLYRRRIYQKFSHLGKQNFLRYGYRAADIMNSSAMRRQLKPLWQRLIDEIERP